jgi:hypothetical protein
MNTEKNDKFGNVNYVAAHQCVSVKGSGLCELSLEAEIPTALICSLAK